MYKDKDKQRESNRLAAKRYRQRKGMMGVTVSKCSSVIPDGSTNIQYHNPMMVGYVPPSNKPDITGKQEDNKAG